MANTILAFTFLALLGWVMAAMLLGYSLTAFL